MPDELPGPASENSPPEESTTVAGEGPTGGSTWRMEAGDDGGSAARLSGATPPMETIGDFEVLGKLGQGGMGTVYRARQRSLDRLVALKILPAQFEADAEFVGRFQREARVAAGLNHGNLVKVYAAGAASGCHYIAMELIEGETLGDWLKRGAVPAEIALRITLDVARALQHGWQRAQLIHRDIKPANIFLSARGDVKVGDLGLAKSLGGESTGLTQTGTMMGTPHYISPEQARGDRDLDFRADIYSLGCTLFQMLTGRTPYEGSSPLVVMRMHCDSPPPAILKAMPQCPIPVARLVGKMLKKAKRERQATYEELIAQIETVQAQLSLAAGIPLENTLPPDAEATPPAAAASPVAAVYDRRAGDASSDRQEAPGERSLPGKPRVAPAVAITTGIVLLGVLAFVFWPREEKLTKAQIYARDHAAVAGVNDPGAPASVRPAEAGVPGTRGGRTMGEPTTTAMPGVATSPAAVSNPAAIKLWTNAAGFGPADPHRSWENGVIWLDGIGANTDSIQMRDVIVRGSVRANADAQAPRIYLRERKEGEAYVSCNLGLDAAHGEAYLTIKEVSKNRTLQKWRLPRTYGPDEWVPLELKAVGDLLTASVDGQVLGSVRDATNVQPGVVGIWAKANGYFRDIEYVPLDKPASAPFASLTAEPWQDVLHDPAKLDLSAGVERTSEGLRINESSGAISRGNPQRDGAVRMRATFTRGNLQLRARLNGAGNYVLIARNEKQIALLRYDAGAKETSDLRIFPLREPLLPGQDYEFELRVVGQMLTAKLNGELLGTAADGTFAEGRFGVGVPSHIPTPAVVKTLEVLDLDAPGGASAQPASAGSAWQPLFTDEEWRSSSPGKHEFQDGLSHVMRDWGRIKTQPWSDGAIRARVVFRENTKEPRVIARNSKEGHYKLVLTGDGKVFYLQYIPGGQIQGPKLGSVMLDPPVASGDRVEIELRAQGDHLAGLLNGVVRIEAIDSRLKGPGAWGIYADDGWFESAEVLDLGAPAGAGRAASPTAPSPGALGESALPPEPWQDVLRDPAKLELKGGAERTTEGIRLPPRSWITIPSKQTPERDGALRLRANFGDRPTLRARVQRGGLYKLSLKDAKTVWLGLWDSVASQSRPLREFPIEEPLKEGEGYELELRVVGQTLTAKLNGRVIGTVTDGTFADGEFGLEASGGAVTSALVNSLEVLDLDSPGGAGRAASPTAPSPGALGESALPAEPWQDVLHDPAKLELSGAVERTPDGLRFTNAGAALRPNQGPQRDGAVRMRATFGGSRPQLRVRARAQPIDAGVYQLFANDEKVIWLNCFDPVAKKWKNLNTYPLRQPLQPGQDYELELRIIGQMLTAKCNGEVLGTFTDGTVKEGQFYVGVSDNNGAPALVKSLEILDLDTPGGAGRAAPPTAPSPGAVVGVSDPALPPASVRPARAAPPPEPWQDLLRDPAKLGLSGGAGRTPEGLRFTPGATAMGAGSARLMRAREQPAPRDVAVRMKTTFGGPLLGLMVRESAQGSYRLYFRRANLIVLDFWDNQAKRASDVQEFPLPHAWTEGQEYELELRVRGQTFTVILDRMTLGTVNDAHSSEGNLAVLVVDPKGSPGMVKVVKSFEVLDLDTPGGASAVPFQPAVQPK